MRTWGIKRLQPPPRRPTEGMGEVTIERRVLTPRGQGEESDIFVIDLEGRMLTPAVSSALTKAMIGERRRELYLYQHVNYVRGDLPIGTLLLREQRDYAVARTLIRTSYCIGKVINGNVVACVAWDLGEHVSVQKTGWFLTHVINYGGRQHTLLQDCASATAVLPP
jgi:hypothetical protein